MRITTEDIYGLDFQYYAEAVLRQHEYQESFGEPTYYFQNDLEEVNRKPQFDPDTEC